MAGTENDARYPPTTYGMSQDYAPSNRQKTGVRNVAEDHFVEDDDGVEEELDVEEIDEDEDEDEEVEEVEEIDDDGDDGDDGDDDEDEDNGAQRFGSGEFQVENDDGDGDDDDDDDDDGDDDDDDDDDDGDLQRHPKKRKLKSLLSSYEFAPRVPAPKLMPTSAPAPKSSGRNSIADWTEQETFALLGAWGEKFLKHGRKSLRSEEWHEVAVKVTQETRIERTDTQCRNRLDTLKKKYKKEKEKYGQSGFFTSKWLYFQKIDGLLTSPVQQQSGLLCGVDSGEYVFSKDGNRSNGLDWMGDSPGASESADGEEDSGGPPSKRKKNERHRDEGAAPFKVLADSIHKFSSIYEKIETTKRHQIMELEKMRMDLHRDMELQKRQILEKAQAEIVKIRRGDDEENDNNVST